MIPRSRTPSGSALLDARNATTVQVVRDVRARLIGDARARLQGGRPADAAALLDAAESLGWRCRSR
jgi:hypothetical protein